MRAQVVQAQGRTPQGVPEVQILRMEQAVTPEALHELVLRIVSEGEELARARRAAGNRFVEGSRLT